MPHTQLGTIYHMHGWTTKRKAKKRNRKEDINAHDLQRIKQQSGMNFGILNVFERMPRGIFDDSNDLKRTDGYSLVSTRPYHVPHFRWIKQHSGHCERNETMRDERDYK